ncbi:MAG TPA: hypothetical protein VN903_03170 [Polyangia bacterium]|jgi:hypothetical protein|nr:hypothetical protein [Polyangia bacterium]
MHAQIFSSFVTRKPVRGITCAMWFVMAAGAVAVGGCAPQFQTQLIGQTTTIAGPPSAGPAAVAEIPVPESHSPQVLQYVVSLPRAVQLHYQVTCPSAEREGRMGETFESYRTRRLAELERERQQQANLIGSLVGAVAPPVRAGAAASGPGGSATATAEINPGAAAAEAARESLPPASLPPGDYGATVVRGKVELGASPAGRCALTLVTDPAAQDASGAQVFLELVRLVDVEAEERARQAAVRAEQDKKALELRGWLLGSLQRHGADPMARARARAVAQAQAEEDARRRQAAADEDARRRQAAADEEARRRQAATAEEYQRQREAQVRADQERWRQEQARLAKENAARSKEWQARQAAFAVRWQITARLQRLGADPFARQRAQALAQVKVDEENRRRQTAEDENRRRQAAAEQERLRREREVEQDRLRREREAAAERERREAPERERRAREERERLAKEEAARQARLAKEEADGQAQLAADHVRINLQIEARAKLERDAAERRAREWRARQAAVALRWQIFAWLQRQGADPYYRQHQEEARLAARREEQRRQYEAKARHELELSVARRTAFDLRFNLVARLQGMGADPDFRRKRDEAMFREMDAEAKHLASARAEAAERVRWETQAALDLRVLTKLRLRQVGAVDRPTCPPPPVETPPPAPFAGATWIQGRYDWNGIAWIWASGHYERPPEIGTVWVPPAQIAVSGTLVVRPGRWVRISIGAPPPRQ